MRTSSAKTWTTAVLALVMLIGVLNIYTLRYESGNLYPDYSSILAGPMGTKGLFETIDQMQDYDAIRVERPSDFRSAPMGRGDLIFAIGVKQSIWSSQDSRFWEEAKEYVEDGATIVLAIDSRQNRFLSEGFENEAEDEKVEDEPTIDGEGNAEDPIALEVAEPDILAINEWFDELGITVSALEKHLEQEHLDSLSDFGKIPVPPITTGLSRPFPLKALRFLEFGEGLSAWESIYSLDGFVVGAERALGEGRFIVFSDAYPFTNEALMRDRNAELFAWLLGDHNTAHFLDIHLGVAKRRGLIELARNHGFGISLILAFAMMLAFLWRATFSDLPRTKESFAGERERHFTHSNAGLINLLASSVPDKQICETLRDVWRESRANFPGRQGDETIVDSEVDRFLKSKRKVEDAIDFYNNTAASIGDRRRKDN